MPENWGFGLSFEFFSWVFSFLSFFRGSTKKAWTTYGRITEFGPRQQLLPAWPGTAAGQILLEYGTWMSIFLGLQSCWRQSIFARARINSSLSLARVTSICLCPIVQLVSTHTCHKELIAMTALIKCCRPPEREERLFLPLLRPLLGLATLSFFFHHS